MELNIAEIKEFYCTKKLSMKKIGLIFHTSPQTVMRFIHKNQISVNKYPTAWNSGKTYKEDSRILSKERHPRYINGASYNSDFHSLCKTLLPCRCSSCTNPATLLHHKDKNIQNNKKENLLPFCVSCHTILHNKQRGITKFSFNCLWCGKKKTVLHRKNCKQKCCSLTCKAKYSYYNKLNSLYHKNNPLKKSLK